MKSLKSDRIYLRNFIVSDVDTIYSYRSLDKVALYQYWYPYTKEQTLEFINKNKNSDLNNRNEWNGFAIIHKTNNALIGDCAIKITEYSAEIGCNISPLYQNEGLAKETLQLLINYCFNLPYIYTIYGITDSQNTPSIRLMKALGMKKDNNFEEKLICKNLPCTEHKYFITKK